MPRDPVFPQPPPSRPALFSLLSAGAFQISCLLVAAIGAVALVTAILHRGFDYDEVEHAHAVWLVSTGAKPFYDFFECHPPFFWYPLALLVRALGASYDLLFLFRASAAIGQVAFLVGILKNVALSLRELRTPRPLSASTAALAASVIAFHPAIFAYLAEFRIDSWPNAILVLGMYRYRSRRQEAFNASIGLGITSVAAVLCSPKLILLAGFFAGLTLLSNGQRLRRLSGMSIGAAGTLVLGIGTLKLAGLNPILVYRVSLLYHQVLNSKGGFGHGLFDMVRAHTVGRNVLLVSILAWAWVCRRTVYRCSFEIAVLLFLALQLKLVSFNYKQYYAPWYLLGITFLPYLEVSLRTVRPLHSLLLAAGLIYCSSNALEVYGQYNEEHAAETYIASRKELERLVPSDGYAVGSMQTVPLFRRDVFYAFVNSYAPSGFDGAHIMRELNVVPLSSRFTEQAALSDLEARPPSIILLEPPLRPEQKRALDTYFAKHVDEYVQKPGPVGPMLVRRQ